MLHFLQVLVGAMFCRGFSTLHNVFLNVTKIQSAVVKHFSLAPLSASPGSHTLTGAALIAELNLIVLPNFQDLPPRSSP